MKRLSLLVLTGILIALFTAPTMAQEEVTLFFHAGEGGEREALDTILTNFNESQDDYVATATQLPNAVYTDQVIAAGIAGELPCLLDLDGPTLYNFAWSGFLQPIDDFASDELLADILPSIVSQGTYNDHIYTLGVFDSGLAIWGNRALLDEAGVRIPTGIDDAWDLDEFNAALEALTALDSTDYAIDFKFNYGAGEWFTYGFSPIIQSFGGDLIDRMDYQSAEGVLNGPEAVAAMEWFQSLFENGYATATPADDNQLINGNAALSWVGHWEFPRYSAELGDDLVLIPMPKFGESAATGMGSWNWGITTQCDNPEGAWAVLDFMLQPEQMQIMTASNGAVPSRISVLEADENYAEGGILNVYFQQLTQGVAVPRPETAAYPTITSAFATAVDEIAAGADVQDALDEAVDIIDQDIADNDGYVSQ